MRMLTRDEAQKQAKRLQSAPALAPQSDDGRKEIVDCLLRNCSDKAHAERTMTMALDSAKDPKSFTAEITAAASATRRDANLPAGCPECDLGKDPLTQEPRWAAHISGERNGFSCALRCHCARGRYLAKRDAEHESAAARKATASAATGSLSRAGDEEMFKSEDGGY